jgi:hypothetical protein
MSNLPDAYCEAQRGETILVANKKARKLLNAQFEKPGPRWGKVRSDLIRPPEYRALILEAGPCLAAMLVALFDAGFEVMYQCTECDAVHTMGGRDREKLWLIAQEGAVGVMPQHETPQ